MRKLLITLLIIVFNSILVFCQNIETELLSISAIQTEKINSIHSISEDKSGFLWLATDKGLYTFDGNSLKRFDRIDHKLKKAFYTYVLVDSKDRIWAGTFMKGLICIDHSRSTVDYFTHLPSDTSSLADNRIKLIFEDYKNDIWIATHTSGLNKYIKKTKKFKHYLPSELFPNRNKRNLNDFISHRRDNNHNNIEWIGTLDGLLRLNVDNHKYDLYYCDEKSALDKNNLNGLENQLRTINFIPEGLLLGTWGGGICKLDTADNKWNCFKFEPAFPKSHIRNNVLQTMVFENNKIILSIFGKGTQEYDPNTNTLIQISENNLSFYLIDSQGQEWYVFNKNKLYVRTKKEYIFESLAIPNQISAFYYDKDQKQFYSGIYNQSQVAITDLISKKSKVIDYSPIHDNGKNWISSIQKDLHGRLILLENRDIYTLKENKFFPVINIDSLPSEEKLSNNSIISTLIDSDDDIWIGYKESGILRIKKKTKEHFIYNEKSGIQHSGWISVFYEDKQGRIWIGTEKSISYFNKNDNKFYNIIDSSRSFEFVYSIIQDSKNNFWVGEGDNILKINTGSSNDYSLQTIVLPENIGSNVNIYKIDSLNNLWGATSKGIFYYDTKKRSFKFWGSLYGFKNIIGIDFYDKDTMLVVTFDDVLKGGVRDLFNISNNSKLDFTYLKLFNKDYNYNNKPLSELQKIVLNYKQNFLTIGFSLKEIINPEDLFFEYKLKGQRNKWIPLENRTFIEFSHLNPGNYILQLRQADPGQNYVYSKKLNIIIQSPFWQQLWFKLLILTIIVAGIYQYIYNRKKKMKLTFEKELEFQKKLANVEMMALKSQMNPHFVFNCLNTIKLFVIENETEKASRYISDFAKLLRIALNESRLNLTTLQGEIESIKLYIELEKMRFEQKFDYIISYPRDIDLKLYKVPPMLLQPFVENAIIHGILPSQRIGKLTIDIKKVEGYFIYTILDNGIGRKASQKYKDDSRLNPSLGIKITNDRLKLIKTIYGMEASINIYDLEYNGKAQGTKVVVKIPIIIET